MIIYREKWDSIDREQKLGVYGTTINIERTMMVIRQILVFAKEIYNKFGFYGQICVGLEMTGALGMRITSSNLLLPIAEDKISNENLMQIKQFFPYVDFENFTKVIGSIIEVFNRSFGLVLPDRNLEELLKEIMKK